MRYIIVEEIKEGMILAKDLFSDKGKVLLKKNVSLDSFYINFIRNQGIESVCIQEEKDKKEIKEPDMNGKLLLKYDIKNNLKELFKNATLDENMMIIFDAIIENELRKKIYE